MAVVEVGNSERINIEQRRDLLRLWPAAAGARIELQLTVATVVPQPTISAGAFQITADLHVSRFRNRDERLVCQLTARHTVTPAPQGAHLTLTGFISLDQLRVIEEIRAGNDLVLHLDLAAFTTATGGLDRYRGDEHVDVRADEWAR